MCEHISKAKQFCVNNHCDNPSFWGCTQCFKKHHIHGDTQTILTQNDITNLLKKYVNKQPKDQEKNIFQTILVKHLSNIRNELMKKIDDFLKQTIDKLKYPFLYKNQTLSTFRCLRDRNYMQLKKQDLVKFYQTTTNLNNPELQRQQESLYYGYIDQILQKARKFSEQIKRIESLFDFSLQKITSFNNKLLSQLQIVKRNTKNIENSIEVKIIQYKSSINKDSAKMLDFLNNYESPQKPAYERSSSWMGSQTSSVKYQLSAKRRQESSSAIQVRCLDPEYKVRTIQELQTKPINPMTKSFIEQKKISDKYFSEISELKNNAKPNIFNSHYERLSLKRQMSFPMERKMDSQGQQIDENTSKQRIFSRESKISLEKQYESNQLKNSGLKENKSQSKERNKKIMRKIESVRQRHQMTINQKQQKNTIPSKPNSNFLTIKIKSIESQPFTTSPLAQSIQKNINDTLSVQNERYRTNHLQLKKKRDSILNETYEYYPVSSSEQAKNKFSGTLKKQIPLSPSNDKQRKTERRSLSPLKKESQIKATQQFLNRLAKTQSTEDREEFLKKHLQQYDSNITAASYLSYHYLKLFKARDCLTLCEKYIQCLDEIHAEQQLKVNFIINKSAALNLLGKNSQAIAFLQKRLLAVQHEKMHKNLADAYQNINLKQKAIYHYEKATSLNKQYDEAFFNLAVVLFKQKMYNNAKMNVEKAISIAPNEFYYQLLIAVRQRLQSK